MYNVYNNNCPFEGSCSVDVAQDEIVFDRHISQEKASN